MPQTARVRVHLGDCLPILQRMESGSVDLAYLDPPFFKQKVHRLGPRDRSREFSFADFWPSRSGYASFLRDRLIETHRSLSDRGSLFFHCDRTASHIIRFLLDDVFGSDNFRAEIIWHYRRWSNSRQGLLPTHQTILHYTKTNRFIFNELRTEYSPATNVDQILQRRSRDKFNKSVYDRDADGKVIPGSAKRGVPLGDVWDIPFLNPKARERTGYPTQKPLLLLERIISLATDADSCVLDPFCGSGTTLVAARALGRRAIGMDISADAIVLTKKRLRSATRSSSRVLEVGRETYRTADESALAMLRGLDCVPVQRNRGIDAILKEEVDGGPVPIRVQRPDETPLEAAMKLAKAAAKNGAKVMFVVLSSNKDDSADEWPKGVIGVPSAGLSIQEQVRLAKSQEGNPQDLVRDRGETSDPDESRDGW